MSQVSKKLMTATASLSQCLSDGKPGKAANVSFYGVNKVLCFIVGLALATTTVADYFVIRSGWSAGLEND